MQNACDFRAFPFNPQRDKTRWCASEALPVPCKGGGLAQVGTEGRYVLAVREHGLSNLS